MQPEWIQDSKTKNLQPKQIPQFEVAGNQLDNEYYDKAVKLVVGRVSLALLVLLSVPLAYHTVQAVRSPKTDFGRMKVSKKEPFKNKITLRVHKVSREKEIKGRILTSKARPGFSFLVFEVSVTNRADQYFQLSPYSFALSTDSGKNYTTALATKSIRNRLGNQRLKTDKTARGLIVFDIPERETLRSLAIRGAKGSLAEANF